jgi:protein O-GlcNAc transferase
LSTRFEHPGWRDIVMNPARVGPYIDLFCGLAATGSRGLAGARFLKVAAAWMLALDKASLAILVNRYTVLKETLEVDLAEHLRALMDAVLERQLARGLDPVETPGQFLLRRDDPDLARQLAENFMARTERHLGDAAWSETTRPDWTWTPDRKLRIGYVCSDLAVHPVGLSVRSLMLAHDKARFEIFLYDRTPRPDPVVAGPMHKGADHVRACLDLSPAALEEQVRADRIDILVDLSGAVIGRGDTVFSRPAAPVRVSMIGYPGSMGAGTVDYAIVDRDAVPKEFRSGYGESLIFMPRSFLPLDETFEIGEVGTSRAEIGLSEDGFVMAAFNRLDKVTLGTVRMWIACLQAIPKAVLWISTDDRTAIGSVESLVERTGLPRDRLLISPKVSVLEHARRHTLADVSLDPLGYNGGYTTALSLRCGVPVVSRPGRSFAWRMSAGMLRAVGLEDCVVETPAAYLDQVRRIAEDRDYAASLRGKLAPDKLFGVLGTRRYAAALEQAFLVIAEQKRQGQAPRDIVIDEARA